MPNVGSPEKAPSRIDPDPKMVKSVKLRFVGTLVGSAENSTASGTPPPPVSVFPAEHVASNETVRLGDFHCPSKDSLLHNTSKSTLVGTVFGKKNSPAYTPGDTSVGLTEIPASLGVQSPAGNTAHCSCQ